MLNWAHFRRASKLVTNGSLLIWIRREDPVDSLTMMGEAPRVACEL